MGLIKAVTGTAYSYISDLWEDYIYCDALDENTLVRKGKARASGGTGDNPNDNVITEGSRIAVNAGQMLLVVENGKIVDFTAEQGGYEYHSRTEPSLFCGEFGEKLKTSFEEVKARFAFGGQPANDQRVYFVNIKEIMNNRFGFGNVPYRDAEFNITILLKGFGIYSYKVANPILFYTKVCGNVTTSFTKQHIDMQLKTEMQNAMLPVLGQLANEGIHYDQVSLKTDEMVRILKKQLNGSWEKERGIEVQTVAFGNILPDEESIDKIRTLQESRVYSENKSMLGARVGAAQANAMEMAAENSSGAVNGFMGVNMAQQTGNTNVAELMREEKTMQISQEDARPDAEANTWTCSCGMVNYMAFCPQCGSKRPEKKTCPACGFVMPTEMVGFKFCPNCGQMIETVGQNVLSAGQAEKSPQMSLESEIFAMKDKASKMQIIKYYMDKTGAGLAAAKAYVERIIE